MSNNLAHALISELERESVSTARLLERVPVDQADWRPHPRSTALGALAWHIANIPRRISGLIAAGSFDILQARPGAPPDHHDYVAELNASVEEAKRTIGNMDDAAMMAKSFRFMRGEETIRELPVVGALRSIMLNHTYHHRGQLTVYLRLLEIPVPAMYGTTADENPFA
ncbi:MAG TPA: DinB family protein [Thermoanaerobaculia bacterium]